MIRIGPGASGTIDSIKLIQMSERADAPEYSRSLKREFRGFEDGGQSGRYCGGRCDVNGVGFDRSLWIGALADFVIGWTLDASSLGPGLFFPRMSAHGDSLRQTHAARRLPTLHRRELQQVKP